MHICITAPRRILLSSRDSVVVAPVFVHTTTCLMWTHRPDSHTRTHMDGKETDEKSREEKNKTAQPNLSHRVHFAAILCLAPSSPCSHARTVTMLIRRNRLEVTIPEVSLFISSLFLFLLCLIYCFHIGRHISAALELTLVNALVGRRQRSAGSQKTRRQRGNLEQVGRQERKGKCSAAKGGKEVPTRCLVCVFAFLSYRAL
uniref:Uncharacterized protein n=1 Tax=Trypanosoma vivax (strain Y486) TaxID=1055687 RepID=G0UCY2_TRYVY|nr:hypothetical protein TVY486_1111760 [Trypanosoma vivax Y486]